MGDGKRKVEIVGRVDTTSESGPPRWNPDDAAPHLERAAAAMQRGDLTAAQTAFMAGVAAGKHDPRPHGGLALVAMQRQDWAKAVVHGQAAVARRDPGMEAHYNLGWALHQLGEDAAAIEAWQEAFRADPTRPEPIHQLARLGQVPAVVAGESAESVPLGTLERLELYDTVGRAVHHVGSDGTFRHTVEWAIDRGAPWGGIAAWLADQGVHDDGSLISVLSARDQHLSDSFVSGFLLCDGEALRKAAKTVDDLVLLAAGVDPTGRGVLSVRIDGAGERALIPMQRTSAAHVVGLVQGIFPSLGPGATLVLIVDPAAHLGPRRVWFVSPVADHEVIGQWRGTMEDGTPAPVQVVPDGSVIPAETVPLYVPGVNRAGLEAMIRDHLLQDIVRAVEPDGMAAVRADDVGRYEGAWFAFLAAVAAKVPPGSASLARWRQGGDDRLAILRAELGVQLVTLECQWPADEVDAPDLPVPPPIVFLGRALFQAPRPSL